MGKNKNSIINIIEDIGNSINPRDFLQNIKYNKIEIFSYYLITIWLFTPIIVSIRNIFLVINSTSIYLYNRMILGLYWYQVLKYLGFLGLIVMIIIILKRYYQYNNVKEYVSNNSCSFLILLLLWSIISTILSDSLNLSFNGSSYRKDGLLTYFAYLGFLYLGVSLNSKNNIIKIMKSFAIIATVLSVFMIIDVDSINRLFNFYPNSSVFYNINHFGYYLCMSIIASAGLVLLSNNKKAYYINLVSYSILVIALVKNRLFGCPLQKVHPGIKLDKI